MAQQSMRSFLQIITGIFCFTFGQAYATPVVHGVSGSWDLGVGYRTDNVDWGIAGPFGFPNVLTDVKWESLQVAMVQTRGHITACDHIYLRGSADWGWILRGDNRVREFAGDDFTLQVSELDVCKNCGNVADLSAGIGVNLLPWNSGVEFAPLVGYSFHQQRIKSERAFEAFNINPLLIGPVALNLKGFSSYHSDSTSYVALSF